jgi:RNA polymerase sigma-70 factor (ECF subfamily)
MAVQMDNEQELQLIAQAHTVLQAFALLYDHYFPLIYAYCLNRLGNKEQAEDITSQVFMKLIKAIKDFDQSKNNSLKPLLFSMAHNLMIDMLRKESKSTELNELHMTHTPDLDRPLILSEMQTKIFDTLNRINPRYEEIIGLKYYAELTPEEIAKIMGIDTIKNVYVLLHRALKAFKDEFKDNFDISEIFDLLET